MPAGGLSDKDEQRCKQLLAFTVNLEHVGDIIDRSLRAMAAKKIKYQLTFSPEGQPRSSTCIATCLRSYAWLPACS